MPRFPKRLLALGGLAAGAAVLRRRRAGRPTPPAPSPSAPPSSAPPVAAAGATASEPAGAPPAAVAQAQTQDQAERTTDALVDEETRLAAAEAAAIGGPGVDDAHGDPAMEPVYESGEGVAEGFELAEEDLVDNATHGDGRADPTGDAFTAEQEADEATALGGEADEEKVSEVVFDPSEQREDDPDVGPGITHER
jgi:hypothetical protein